MVRVFIGIGSNINPAQNIRAGVEALARKLGPVRLSSVYESKAVGFDGPDFYNLVAEVQSDLSVKELYHVCRDIEVRFGRERSARKFSSRTLDLDLLLVGQLIVGQETTTEPSDPPSDLPQLPRPEIDFNAFVLWPLAEIAPHLIHPLHQCTLASLWQAYMQQHAEQLSRQLWPIQFDWAAESAGDDVSANELLTASSRSV